MSGSSQGKLLNALDLHFNILQAEKIAIEARDLDTVENLLKTKDESLSLVYFKSEIDDNFTKEVQDRINSVVSLQSSNTQNFENCTRKITIKQVCPSPPILFLED